MEHLKRFSNIRLLLIVGLSGVFLFSVFSMFRVGAQSPAASETKPEASPSVSASPSPTPTPPPKPVPLLEIITEKEKTEERIREINQKLAAQSAVSRTQADLAELLKDHAPREQEANEVLGSNPSLEDLNRIERYWSSIALGIPSRKARLQTQTAEISAQLAELKNSQIVWELTARSFNERSGTEPADNSALSNTANTNTNADPNTNANTAATNTNANPKTNLNINSTVNVTPAAAAPTPAATPDPALETPANLKAQVADIIEKIKLAQRLVQANFNDLLALQERLSGEERRTEEMLAKIAATRSALLSNLTFRDSPPIWSREIYAGGFQQEVKRASSLSLTGLRAYFADHWGLFLFHLLAIFGLIFAFHRARRKTREFIAAEPKLKPALVIFESPIAAALIVGLFLGPFIYFGSPELLGVIASPLLVLVIGYVFSKLIERQHLPVLAALVALYLINDVRLLTAPVPLLSRLIFLTEMAGGIIFIAWFIRSQERLGISQTVRAISIFILVLFSFALLMNVLGFTSLARVVGSALVSSLSFGFILYALARVADSLVVFLFRIRPFSTLRMIRNHRALIQGKVFSVIKWVAVVVWFVVSLGQIYLLTPTLELFGKILTYEAGIGAIKISLSGIIALVVIIWGSFLLSRFIRFALDEDVYPRVNLAKGLPYAASSILHYVILLFGVFIALGAAGIDLNKFTIFLGALGVGVGIGLQNIVENFTSGLILLLERPVKVGDSIQMSNYQGRLKHIGLRSSIVKTFEGAEVIVPNGQLITEEVTNWTLSDVLRRLDINVGVEYGTDPETVINLLEEVGRSHSGALADPPVRTLFVGFGPDSLDFQLRVWTAEQGGWIYIKSELTVNVYKALKEANIGIPFPQRDIHIRSIDDKVLENIDLKRVNKVEDNEQ